MGDQSNNVALIRQSIQVALLKHKRVKIQIQITLDCEFCNCHPLFVIEGKAFLKEIGASFMKLKDCRSKTQYVALMSPPGMTVMLAHVYVDTSG